jgi:hypothetical protein
MCEPITSVEEEPNRITNHLDTAAEERVAQVAGWMQANDRGNAVITRSVQITPGFGPQESKSHLEKAAGLRGMYIHYKSFRLSALDRLLPAYYALLSTQESLSDREGTAVVERYNRDRPPGLPTFKRLAQSRRLLPQRGRLETGIVLDETDDRYDLSLMRWMDDGGPENL